MRTLVVTRVKSSLKGAVGRVLSSRLCCVCRNILTSFMQSQGKNEAYGQLLVAHLTE